MGDLPIWAQNAGIIAIALISAIIGVFRYLKTEIKDTPTKIESSIEPKMLRDIVTAIIDHQEEQSRDAKKSHRLSQDLKESVNELNESIIVHTDTTMNLVRLVNRRIKLGDMNENT